MRRAAMIAATIIAGILDLVAAFFLFILTLLVVPEIIEDVGVSAEDSLAYVLMAIAGIVTILAVIGGICALLRRLWALALTGPICAVIGYGIGIPAVILVLLSKKEFGRQITKRSPDQTPKAVSVPPALTEKMSIVASAPPKNKMASIHCKVCGQNSTPRGLICSNCGGALFTPAGFGKRATAAAIDWIGPPVIAFVLWFASSIMCGYWLWDVVNVIILLAMAVFLGLGTWYLCMRRLGVTPGRVLVGIKIIDECGKLPSLRRCALRESLKLISLFTPLGIGVLWIIWDKQKQSWHDKIFGTYVVIREGEGETHNKE